jgi:hypothetical protein
MDTPPIVDQRPASYGEKTDNPEVDRDDLIHSINVMLVEQEEGCSSQS